MRRLAAVVVAVLVLAAGCSSDSDGDEGAASTTTTSTSIESTTSTTAGSAGCNGIGPSPTPPDYEITWIEGGKLWAQSGEGAKRCLRDGVQPSGGLAWGGAGDRALLGTSVIHFDGKVEDPFTAGGMLVLSRPTGKSVLEVRDGRLRKRELGKPAAEITFVPSTGQSVYHPAGQHIVSVGRVDGKPVLQIATNTGQGATDLVDNHGAQRIYDPTFTASGALLFFADHGSYTDLHRLEIDAGKLTEVARHNGSGNAMANLRTSPYEGGGVAWSQGVCADRRLRATREGVYLKTEGTSVERGDPVGWTPDAGLLVLTPNDCSSPGARALWLFKDGKAMEVAKDVGAAAVRAAFPPNAAPPEVIPQQAPA